jgi:hypothetical protein
MEESRDATSDDKNGPAGAKFGQSLPTEHTGQWLNEYGLFRRNPLRQKKYPTLVDIDSWNTDELSEPPGIEIGASQRITNSMKTIETVMALITA